VRYGLSLLLLEVYCTRMVKKCNRITSQAVTHPL
jgi:hypothetical protein